MEEKKGKRIEEVIGTGEGDRIEGARNIIGWLKTIPILGHKHLSWWNARIIVIANAYAVKFPVVGGKRYNTMFHAEKSK